MLSPGRGVALFRVIVFWDLCKSGAGGGVPAVQC